MPARDTQPPLKLDELEHPSLLEAEYKRLMKKEQLRLLNLQMRLTDSKRNVIVVLEGPDAAGKGGAIKRMVERLDPRLLRVYSIVKPTVDEYQNHYLRRFWLRLPRYGQMGIFDRSWYGRVLVERVEGFATEAEWKRAYGEINEFEELLTHDGTAIVKLFLQITKDEQLKRFKRREADPYKHWKINDEDWRNRKKWKEHVAAAEEMIARTSTEISPWHVIAADYKWYARLQTIQIVADRVEKIFAK